ncbi:MAG: phosphatidylglycerophosphatase A [Syntrophobacteria bacterium]
MSSNHTGTLRKDDLVVFLATGFFSGFLPRIPGTWGTFAAIPVVMLAHQADRQVQLLSAVLFVGAAVWISGKAEILLGGRDPGPIVIDEMCGFVITLLWLPLTLWTISLGFVLFRCFDILKPPPIGSLERRLRGGWGVVMDDVAAGIYANVSLRVLLLFLNLS